jgi:hypothetical protein
MSKIVILGSYLLCFLMSQFTYAENVEVVLHSSNTRTGCGDDYFQRIGEFPGATQARFGLHIKLDSISSTPVNTTADYSNATGLTLGGNGVTMKEGISPDASDGVNYFSAFQHFS